MISVFIPNNPLLSPDKDGTWTLMADWRVWVDDRYYTIPLGFTTDGASIPRFLWRICGHPMEAPRLYLAIIHDWFYSGGFPGVTRRYADAVFRDGQICVGVRKTHAYVEWLALRLCGRSHWTTKTKGKSEMNKLILVSCLASLVLAGCGKSVDVEGKGMYANVNSGTVGIGEFEVVTYPDGVEGARIKYAEDTPWLSPGTKTHAFKIDIVGTNACAQVSGIVSNICSAFILSASKIAAINNGVVPHPTNAVETAAQ